MIQLFKGPAWPVYQSGFGVSTPHISTTVLMSLKIEIVVKTLNTTLLFVEILILYALKVSYVDLCLPITGFN